MIAETMVITRLSVIEDDGVTWNTNCGAKEIPNTAIPRITGTRLRSLAAAFVVERSSPTAAIPNATSGKKKATSKRSFIFAPSRSVQAMRHRASLAEARRAVTVCSSLRRGLAHPFAGSIAEK